MDRTQTLDHHSGDARETLPMPHGMVPSKWKARFARAQTILAGAQVVVVFGALTLMLLLLAITEPIC
ncbi:hypothetical protein [Orrella marina]|uniref:Uncharacterized protein n=1 Tax=Orrella marina TaxID=2163011 RepID=A0A2R4XK90_9BURK|nr:hypothetical protein [Orrella marina]AWB34184.1 hypothetical protein DBV39_11245 [Orrella marina]